MDVHLYVYDLTHGMARQLSMQFLGFQIDAVYHTSLVFGGIEYFFGAGVQTCYAGATHHGRPMEIVPLGETQLPMETIQEYLQSLKQIYTPESYDLFAHNCNNFTNDFAMFLVGRGIPDHITSLPKRVLETPFGQMLKPQIDASMRKVTQAPVPQRNIPVANAPSEAAGPRPTEADVMKANGNSSTSAAPFGKVHDVTSLATLEKLLQKASETASTIFFTSSTCAPCKMAYPTFDQLAEEHKDALFVKVDINAAHDVAARYQIRATPTFMTFSRGHKLDEWSGADPGLLKTNVNRVLHQTFPPHPHTTLRLPTLQYGSMKPVTYNKVPPLQKLMPKLGGLAEDETFVSLKRFVQTREADPREAAIPDMSTVASSFQTKLLSLPIEVRFAAVDLLRCAMVDPRISGFFAEERGTSTVPDLLQSLNALEVCPHNLRLVSLHLSCNLFTSLVYVKEIMRTESTLAPLLVQRAASSLLDASHSTQRVASSWLAFNLAVSNYRIRRELKHESLLESQQVELASSLIETLGSEDNAEAVKGQLLSLGYSLFCAPIHGELMDLCQALDAKNIVLASKCHESLAKEVAYLL